MNVRCPSCNCLVEAGEEASSFEVRCASCGQDLIRPPDPGSQLEYLEAETLPVGMPERHDDGDSESAHSKLPSFGDYEVLEEIARGGMGVVYKARQRSLGRTVALKMILSGRLATEEETLRFRSEAEAGARLDHPGIVPIYEIGETGDQQFFSMGFVEGISLADRIADGPLPAVEAAALVKKIAEAIAFAHDHGVIHRDLKPANVLIDSSGEPRVTDFGLAKRVGDASELTATGQILGTPGFMPPEQAAGKLNDVRETADVYSLGAMLYAAICGRPPFQSDNQMDTLLQVIEQEPVPLRLLNPKVDLDLETICLKSLEKQPADRYGSAAAFAADLQRYLDGEPISVQSVNLVARLVRTLKRSKQDVELRSWGAMLNWFGVIILLAEIGIYLHASDGPPYPKHWALAIRLGQYTAMVTVLWRYRGRWSIATGSAERQMLSIWIGFFLASHLIILAANLMATPERPIDELRLYPILAIVSGLTFFVMGSNYWGQCYLYAVAFFIVALLMPLKLSWAPIAFGLVWAFCLFVIARRLHALATTAKKGSCATQ